MRRHNPFFLLTILGALAVACGSKSDDSGDNEDPNDPPKNEVLGEKFDLAPINYTLPVAGSHISGLYNTANQGRFDVEGDEFWALRDMNGDKYFDLVVTTTIRKVLSTEPGDDNILDEVFDLASSPKWHVYLGSAEGFNKDFVEWALPEGGRQARGFNRAGTQGSGGDRIRNSHGQTNKEGDLAWVMRDMDGDGKPDLVVTGAAEELKQVGYIFRVFGGDAEPPYWRVYHNNGSGFDKEPAKWLVPKTPVWDTFSGLSLEASAVRAEYKKQVWEMRDMNGDKRPDILVYGLVDEVKPGPDAGAGGYRAQPPGQPSAPHWDVYLNDGKGFAQVPTPWTLPRQRGQGENGLNATFGPAGEAEDQDNTWDLFDLTGDGKPDLVITARQKSSHMEAFGYPSTSHWEVFVNTGTTFDAMKQWPLPRGGTVSGGFFAASVSSANVPGDDVWRTVDMNGDAKPDLVLTGKFFANGGEPGVYNRGRSGDDPHWMVFLNKGDSFEGENQGHKWALPNPGGLREHGYTAADNQFIDGKKVGDENWTLLDLTADGQPELIRLSDVVEDPHNPGNPQYTIPLVQGLESSPHWTVHKNVP